MRYLGFVFLIYTSQLFALDLSVDDSILQYESKMALVQSNDEVSGLASKLAQLYILKGASQEMTRSERRRAFKVAMDYSVLIMLENEKFQEAYDQGQAVDEAALLLTSNESEGLGWWSTASLYYFKDGHSGLTKPFAVKYVERAKRVMGRLEVVNPEWRQGTNYFNLAIYYHAKPTFAGGSKDIAEQYFAKAAALDEDRYLLLWGKAKYFYSYYDDGEQFELSLRRVLSKDINEPAPEMFLWRQYMVNDAQLMLANLGLNKQALNQIRIGSRRSR